MRPLPSEVIAGVRRTLKEVIEPELASGHAKSRLAEVRAVLAQVDWDDAGFTLAARNRELAEVLRAVEVWRAEDSAVAAAIPHIEIVVPENESMASHQAAYQRLAAVVVALVDPLENWLARHPSHARARDLRRDLVAAL